MISIKPGVNLANLTDAMDAASKIIDECFGSVGCECWITSGNDGIHTGKPVGTDTRDPHYLGKALDFRIWHVPPAVRSTLVEMIRLRLGEPYVVLWEDPGGSNEHLHVQSGKVLA